MYACMKLTLAMPIGEATSDCGGAMIANNLICLSAPRWLLSCHWQSLAMNESVNVEHKAVL